MKRPVLRGGGPALISATRHQAQPRPGAFEIRGPEVRWFMGPISEVQGYYSTLNHPGVEVEDTAVASLRFVNGGLGSILASVSQKPGIHTKVHVQWF